MADVGASLLALGKLLGLLGKSTDGDKDGKDGVVQWAWFGNPKDQILGVANSTAKPPLLGVADPNRSQFLGQLIRALTGKPDAASDPPFPDSGVTFPTAPPGTFAWVPFNDGGDIKVGFVWGTIDGELHLGLGSQGALAPVNPAVLAQLIKIGKGEVTRLIPDILFAGNLPAPGFLTSIALSGEASATPSVTLDVKNKQTPPDDRPLTYQKGTIPGIFAWDCVRLALFVLQAWIHDKVKSNADSPFRRIDRHGFALMGDPTRGITPAPPVAKMGTDPNFKPWSDSVFNVSGGAAGALAFLWHLRALLTGNETHSLLHGSPSFFMKLESGATDGTPPTPADATNGYNPNDVHHQSGETWIGIDSGASGSDFTLLLDIHSSPTSPPNAPPPHTFLRIPLAHVSGGTLALPNTPVTLPGPPNVTDIATFFSDPGVAANCPITFPPPSGNTLTLSFPFSLPDPDIPALGGSGVKNYTLQAVIATPIHATPIRFEVTSPQLPLSLTLPPPDPQLVADDLIGQLVTWIVSTLPDGDSTTKTLKGIATQLAALVASEAKAGTSDVVPLLLQMGELVAGGVVWPVKAGPTEFTLALAQDPTDKHIHLKPSLTYGPLAADARPDLATSLGKLTATLDLAFDNKSATTPAPLAGFSLGFDDLRIGKPPANGSGGAAGAIADLIPDLNQAQGFHLAVDYPDPTTGNVHISGGGKVPTQVNIGPLSLSQLMVGVDNTSLSIGIDLTFQLAFITVSAYELTVSVTFNTGKLSFGLHGLGMSFDGAGIRLSGLFYNSGNDYVGGAAVDLEDVFSLSAIGGYTKLADGDASLFIFAALTAPLGGPPFCFVTGIAGGFGYNRMLPPPTLMAQHPFFQVMSQTIQVSSNPADGIVALAKAFAAKDGDNWIAAGVQFVSFGFINGKVIVEVTFGHDFSISVLGIASFGLAPVAYFEIDILVTVDSEKLLLVAGISPQSYLVHPDIFNLSGDFGLGVWHGGPHQGDFLLSIGGYHPYFQVPEYYPELNRVAVKADVFGFVHLSIECFFACTPQALMAGASVSLSAEFAGIGAGLDVYVDVFIRWDPFFIMARMGVTVWFEFLGRHEIGVDLEIHTPPFGGVAHISLFIVSFDVSFGDTLDNAPPPISLEDFFTKHVGVPATAALDNRAKVALLNTADAAGLIRVIFTAGKTIKAVADTDKAQEGVSEAVKVAPEFEFLVRTHLPLRPVGGVPKPEVGKVVMTRSVHLPLCEAGDLMSSLTVTLSDTDIPDPLSKFMTPTTGMTGMYPLANFGHAPLTPAQADDDSARTAVAGIDTSQPSVELVDGLRFTLHAVRTPDTTLSPVMTSNEEPSDAGETYPLPLGLPTGAAPDTRMPKAKLSFPTVAAGSATTSGITSAILSAIVTKIRPHPLPPKRRKGRRPPAAPAVPVAPVAPAAPTIMATSAPVNRRLRASAPAGTAVAAPPTGATAVAPPASPVRRIELAGVALRVTPMRTPAPAPPTRLRPVALARPKPARAALAIVPIIPAAPAGTPAPSPTGSRASATVTSGQAVHLAIASETAPTGKLTFAGQQTVRAIFTTAFGEPVADLYVAGNQPVAIPPRGRNVLLIGEGMLAGAPASLGSVGIEPTTALYAIGFKEFAGHGCVMKTTAPLDRVIGAGATVTGRDILPKASHFSILFPPRPSGSALLITVAPAVTDPAPAATQMRWRALGATLSGLATVASADLAALVMDVQSAQPWTLELDLTTDWRLAGVVVCDMTAAALTDRLGATSDWNFVDDRFLAPAPPLTTTVTLEIDHG
jgi:hypothetical protein